MVAASHVDTMHYPAPHVYMRSTYEVRENEECDLTTTIGFLCLILKVLRIREGGLLYGGPPCSLMVWIAKFVHKRTRDMPWGDEQWSCAWPISLTQVVSATSAVVLCGV